MGSESHSGALKVSPRPSGPQPEIGGRLGPHSAQEGGTGESLADEGAAMSSQGVGNSTGSGGGLRLPMLPPCLSLRPRPAPLSHSCPSGCGCQEGPSPPYSGWVLGLQVAQAGLRAWTPGLDPGPLRQHPHTGCCLLRACWCQAQGRALWQWQRGHEAGLEPAILLPPPPKCWDHEPPQMASHSFVLSQSQLKNLQGLAHHSTQCGLGALSFNVVWVRAEWVLSPCPATAPRARRMVMVAVTGEVACNSRCGHDVSAQPFDIKD
ncbi:PREDICTED: uncharacterized protein LOC106147507 [Chinchilla lanigera]|uniref:uncharacterized protein LOC106147507 n=1 Tax=Chinchilla lanigera TaxID=34839 RepID=UPI0006981282|nr:PREDICTED: uncharacterized protein LOC106147507 [Chinchilla lanigera]